MYVFPTSERKQMLLMSIKKWQLLKNYPPILPICGKVLERLVYNSMFEIFIHNNLIISNQSGFKTGARVTTNLFPSLTKYTNHLIMATKYGVYF